MDDDAPALDLGLPPPAAKAEAYRVLARKYRPQNFESMVGQEALVRTLSNAFAKGRIAHAFMLTGVRGVGKTTTARIIAAALNCLGADGRLAGPTIKPCGVCANCVQIAESRHVDVFEMDAASRTGIDDIREIIDGVRYMPVAARTKVYIVDEVHMLSKQAFNGLLKTLEEPPPHVKFIFATTEIRKVPVTVLSRCQRFDLRRIEGPVLAGLLGEVCAREGVAVEPQALALIARAAEGSARDGLSLLDQAIAHGGADGAAPVTAQAVRAMLGLADRGRVLDLFEALMRGDLPGALGELRDQYDQGAEPLVVVQELLELAHWITRLKLVPEAARDPAASEAEIERGRTAAAKLTVPALSRVWQLLLKGAEEVRAAGRPILAAEMLCVRIAYAADLPPTDQLLREVRDGQAAAASRPAPAPAPAGSGPAPRAAMAVGAAAAATNVQPAAERAADPVPSAPAQAPRMLAGLPELVALAGEHRELRLKWVLENAVHLVRFEQGLIELRPTEQAGREFAGELARKLQAWTGQRWMVSLSNAEGAPTLAAARAAEKTALKQSVMDHPLVKAALAVFPDARIEDVRRPDAEEPGVDAFDTPGEDEPR